MYLTNEKFKELRKAAKLTQTAAAELLGTKKQNISRIECNYSPLSFEYLHLFAKKLSKNISIIIENS